jgi:putative two-component system response regulator
VRLLDGGRVLAVDDQPANLDLVGEILENDGFTVDTAGSGAAALSQVARQPPDCIVLDVMMPEMDGLTLCRLLKSDHRTRHIPVLMLTALSDVEDKLKSLRAGADDFLNKPVDRQEILARVRSLVRIKRLHDELNTAEAIMVAMTRALESKHPRGAGHADRVALGAVRLGAALDLSPAELHTLGQAAALHDLGKLGVPEVLLTEEGDHRGWGDEEERVFRRHAEMGERILAPLAGFGPVRDLVRHHHERLDGTGYPDQLAGEQFTLSIEALALVNYFENLVMKGTREDALRILREDAAVGRFRKSTVDRWLELEELPMPTGSWRAQLPSWQPARTGTVLVADDDAANRELLAELLEQAGHTVLTAEHGAAVLRLVRDHKPDLLVTDVRMPYLNGFSICRALKADPATEFLPIILVTAARGSDDRREGLVSGADDFLSVPVHKQELRRARRLAPAPALLLPRPRGAPERDPVAGQRARGQGPVHRGSLRPRRRARRGARPPDRPARLLLRAHAHRRAAPRHRQDRRAREAPAQAGQAHPEEFKTIMSHPPAARASAGPCARSRRSCPSSSTTTSATTATATPTGCAASRFRSARACSPSPTRTTRSPRTVPTARR